MPSATTTPTYEEMRKALKALVRSSRVPFWFSGPCLSCPERGDGLECPAWMSCEKRQTKGDKEER